MKTSLLRTLRVSTVAAAFALAIGMVPTACGESIAELTETKAELVTTKQELATTRRKLTMAENKKAPKKGKNKKK